MHAFSRSSRYPSLDSAEAARRGPTGAEAAHRGARGADLEPHARAHRVRRRLDPNRQHALVRHRAQLVGAGHGVRRRRAARHHPHEPPRRDAGPGPRAGRVPESRGSRPHADLSRSDPRLRLLPLRSEAAPIHEADRAQARARGRADRPRHPRRRQRRRRAAVDPRGHDRAARPAGAELRARQLQRLQHLLSAGRVGHVGRLVGLAGRRHRRPRRGAERRRELAGRIELLPAARPRPGRAREDRARRARAARHARDRVRPQAVRRAAPARSHARVRGARARGVSEPDGAARRRASDPRVARVVEAPGRRHLDRDRRQAHRGVRAARRAARRGRRQAGAAS